jgi:RHS repeat-associated protein
VFPSETKDEDTYAYNDAGEMSEVKMLKGTETLASLAYNTRDKDGQVKTITSKGLPGEEKPSYEYDANSRLTKGAGIVYEYDSANNPTKIGAGTYKYNSRDELETGPSLTYTYNEEGERIKTTTATGPATSYGYDQAGNLISVERPKEGEVTEIKDSYAYNGDGLRVSQTIAGTTTYMAWDTAEELPLLLSDQTNSYIYGPGGLPVEQISSGGTTTYLHHDQQGSTRLLTGSAGTVTGKCTYTPYGVPTCEGTTTTPLGFDGQYTSSDTGLIYLRAREYDPATAQFLSVDPKAEMTGTIYGYARDNPLSNADPSGENTEGSQVAHELLALEQQGLKELHSKHAGGKSIELFQRIVKVQLYYGIAYAEAYGPDQRLGNEELHVIEGKLAAEVASQLVSLDSAESAKSVAVTLVKAGWLIFHIYQAEVRAAGRH